MPRPERDLDPSSGPIAAFAAELRKLRVEAGTPKYVRMARLTGRSRTALTEAAGGDHLPTWETVEAYVRACGADPADWLVRWEQVRDTPRPGRTALPVSPPTTQAPAPVAEPARLTRRALVVGGGTLIATGTILVALRSGGTDGTPPPSGSFTIPGSSGAVSLTFARFSARTLAVARSSGQITILDAHTGTPDRTIDLHEPGVTLAAFDLMDRDVLATGGPGGVRLWNYPDGRPLLAFPDARGGPLTHLLSDPDNRHQLATARGPAVTIWDTETGRPIRDLGIGRAAVTALAYDPLTRNTLAVAQQDGTVAIFDGSTGRLVRALRGSFERVTSLAFDPLTRNTLATGEAGGKVRIWDSSSGQPVRPVRCESPVGALAFNPSIRNSLATGNGDGTVRIWDASTGSPVHTLAAGPGAINSLAYSTDGERLAAGSDRGTITVWPVEDWH